MNAALNPYHYAVIVGINYYISDELPRLSGPLNDAKKFACWLEQEGGLDPRNILPVLASASPDDRPLEPTLTAIYDALSNVNEELFAILGHRTGIVPDSRLYIFVAGHGMAQRGVAAALFSTEARHKNWGYVLNLQNCFQWYKDSGPFQEVIMFADVCRTRYEGVNAVGLPFDNDKNPGSKRLIIYYATSDGDPAHEDPAGGASKPDDRRGYFSRALTECLSTAVDPKVGYVTSISLAESISTRVHELSEGHVRPPQDCEAEGSVFPPLRFGPDRSGSLVANKNGFPVTIRIANQICGRELQLLDGSFKVVIDRFFPKAAGDQWQRTLQPGLYGLAWVNTLTAADKGKNFKVIDKPETVDV